MYNLQAFLISQLAFSGPPLLAFTLFSFTVFSSALIVCVLTGLFIALTFTFFCVTAAVLVLLPTLFLTGLTASFFYFWGLVAYLLAHWFNNDPRTEGIRTQAYETAKTVGARANDLSDGRLELAMADSKDMGAREGKSSRVSSGPGSNGVVMGGTQRGTMDTAGSPPMTGRYMS